MGMVMSIKTPAKHSAWRHRLWLCKNYWRPQHWYMCPSCNRTMRCYWDGNDVIGHGTDYCDKCAAALEVGDDLRTT